MFVNLSKAFDSMELFKAYKVLEHFIKNKIAFNAQLSMAVKILHGLTHPLKITGRVLYGDPLNPLFFNFFDRLA